VAGLKEEGVRHGEGRYVWAGVSHALDRACQAQAGRCPLNVLVPPIYTMLHNAMSASP